MRGADFSKFSTDNQPVSSAALMAMAHDGIKVIVPGAWSGDEAYDGTHDTLKNAGDGFHRGVYTVLNMSKSGVFSADAAKWMCGDQWANLAFCALDVELATDEQHIGAAIDEVRTLGQKPVIYTSNAMWQYGETFKDVPLWTAQYEVGLPLLLYGGWNLGSVMGHQYQNTTQAYGIGVDFSNFADEFFAPDAASALAVLHDAWSHDMADLTAGAYSLESTPGDTTRLALYEIYVQNRATAWKQLIGH